MNYVNRSVGRTYSLQKGVRLCRSTSTDLWYYAAYMEPERKVVNTSASSPAFCVRYSTDDCANTSRISNGTKGTRRVTMRVVFSFYGANTINLCRKCRHLQYFTFARDSRPIPVFSELSLLNFPISLGPFWEKFCRITFLLPILVS